MLPGLNPRKMQQMMRKMGIAQVEIPATEVIIRTRDSELVISKPQVSRVKMMGQETFQISGEVHERPLSSGSSDSSDSSEVEFTEADVKTVMEQAGVDQVRAIKALEDAHGDLAKAIMALLDDK